MRSCSPNFIINQFEFINVITRYIVYILKCLFSATFELVFLSKKNYFYLIQIWIVLPWCLLTVVKYDKPHTHIECVRQCCHMYHTSRFLHHLISKDVYRWDLKRCQAKHNFWAPEWKIFTIPTLAYTYVWLLQEHQSIFGGE